MRIAAGEVIEGPFSVVRELIDNALDAESTHIRVTISNGGKDLIQVSDDGTGMPMEDARLAVQKHTTSKIRVIEDLDTLSSMGFRGEALASICAVSDFAMITMRREDAHGTRVYCEAGGEVKSEPSAANPGTEIIVRNLFLNLPARKKFLKSNRAEAAKVKDEIIKKALSFHGKGFAYRADDRSVFSLDPRKYFLERLVDLFGEPFRENLLPVEHTDELFTVHGYISNRKLSLPNRSGQYLFINGRPVTDRSLLFALNSPGRGMVPSGRYIYAFVFVKLDPKLIDVNVHPAKKEVKIKPADRLYSAIYRCVEDALSRGYFGVQVTTGSGRVQMYTGGDSTGKTPPYTDGGFRALHPADQDRTVVREGSPQGAVRDAVMHHDHPLRFGALPLEESRPRGLQEGLFHFTEGDLQYRGSLFSTFLIFESSDSMVLVDQHAAHERICYERYKRMYDGENAVKNLLVPINFTPPPNRYDTILDAARSFYQAGIEIEPFGDESFNILSLPAFIPDNREEETVALLFEELYQGNLLLTVEEIREKFLKLAACRSAIKEGDAVSLEEARALVRDLLSTEVPDLCPHGRPTMVRYSIGYFDKLFKRR